MLKCMVRVCRHPPLVGPRGWAPVLRFLQSNQDRFCLGPGLYPATAILVVLQVVKVDSKITKMLTFRKG